tara:strand:- start:1183 stop:1971 length:789 start_codon:yes stop_codon:yes gene_type:complete
MLYNELAVQNISAVKDRCSGVPIVKVPVLPSDHPAVELGAYICMLAFRAKFQDDLMDEKGFWISRYNQFFQNHLENSFVKKRKTYTKFNIDLQLIQSRQVELKRMEEDPSILSAQLFLDHWGETFGYIMTSPFKNKIDSKRLMSFRHFFSGLGRVINLLDAMADLHDDKKNGHFNPILRQENSKIPTDENVLRKLYSKWKKEVESERAELLQILPSLALHECLPILQNILTHCLDKELKKVFYSMVKKKKQTQRMLLNCKDF